MNKSYSVELINYVELYKFKSLYGQNNFLKLLKRETDFLPTSTSSRSRFYYVLNNLHSHVKCLKCGNDTDIKYSNKKYDIKFCSFSCNVTYIDPITNISKANLIAIKSAKTMKQLDKNGVSTYDNSAKKQQITKSKIQSNGRSLASNISYKASKTVKLNNIKNQMTDNMVKTRSKIDPETNLNSFQSGGIKGSTLEVKNKISISNTITQKTKGYNKLIDKFHDLDEYTILTNLDTYIASNEYRIIEYKHSCGITISSRWDCVICRKCYPTYRGYSKVSIDWLESIIEEEGIDIQHAGNIGEFRIPGTLLHVDGYCEETNTVYEFYGDYFHGNPIKYDSNAYNKLVKKTMGNLYNNTINRENHIKDLRYNLVSIWESEYKITKDNKHISSD